jgi:hypothetical protein
MTRKRAFLSVSLGLLASLCIPVLGVTYSAQQQTPAVSPDAEKAILPDQSWTCGMPDGIPKPEKGTLLFEAELKIDQVYDVGKTQYGQRIVHVILGGEIKCEKFQGEVLPGGLDFQLTLSNGVIEIEQILVIKASDGKFIYVRNGGTGLSDKDVRIPFDFEAPKGSSSEWLGKGKYVARRTVNPTAKTMKLRVYDVAETKIVSDDVVKISKPTDVPRQSWDFRKATPGEKQGEQIITENVTLGQSQSVGATKHGNRNIIPITGGVLSGTITGKVVPGGADYQNLSNPATIDARYLWETNDGEIIIVRNAGAFGRLVPTFEAKVDGKYAWLNSGYYLSSNPGMGAGGVRLTMYKSTND